MRAAILYSGISYQHFFLERDGGKYGGRFEKIIYLPDLKNTDLNQFDYIIVPTRLNQNILMENKEKFADYLQNGGHIIAFGEMPKPWLSAVKWKFYPTNFYWWVNRGADLPLYPASEDHELFRYITVNDAKWHYHGVYLPPSEAEPILVNELGEAIIYVDHASYKGNLYLTTLDPDYHLGQGFIPKTEKFLDGFLKWAESDMTKYQTEKV